MIINYVIEQYNLKREFWEVTDYARTMSEAWEKALRRFDVEGYGELCISDCQGFIIWDSNGFKQGKGRLYPDIVAKENRMKNLGLEQQQEQTYVAPDGSC